MIYGFVALSALPSFAASRSLSLSFSLFLFLFLLSMYANEVIILEI